MIKKYIRLIGILSYAVFISPMTSIADSSAALDHSSNYEKAVSFLQKDQFDPAIEYFQKALQDEHGPAAQARIFNLIGLAYLRQGVSASSAIGSFEQAIKLDPQFAESYFNIASAYASNNSEPQKAAEYFQKTIDVDPKYFKAYFGLGWFLLMQKDDPARAIEYFQKTLEQYPEFAEAHYGMGLAYIRTHKPHMALGSVSQLRGLKRDDLAAVLETAIKEVSAPVESTPTPDSETSVTASASGGAPQQGQSPQRKGHSPFEAMRKGKRAAPQKS